MTTEGGVTRPPSNASAPGQTAESTRDRLFRVPSWSGGRRSAELSVRLDLSYRLWRTGLLPFCYRCYWWWHDMHFCGRCRRDDANGLRGCTTPGCGVWWYY